MNNSLRRSTLTIVTSDIEASKQNFPNVDGVLCPICIVEHKFANRIAGLILIEKDLYRSLDCIDLIPLQTEIAIIEALWLSAVSFYARCFVSGSGVRLGENNLNTLRPELKTFHARAINMRHKYTAHADENEYEKVVVQVVLNSDPLNKGFIGLRPETIRQISPSINELSLFKELVSSVNNIITGQLSKANERLKNNLNKESIEKLYENAIYPPKSDKE